MTWLQTSFGRVAQRVTYVLHGEDTVQLFYCCVKQLSQVQSYSGNPYTQCHWRSLHLKMRKRFKRMGSIPEENLRIPTRSILQVAHCCLHSHKNSIKVLCSSSAGFYARSTLNTSDHSPVHRDPAHDNRVKDDQSIRVWIPCIYSCSPILNPNVRTEHYSITVYELKCHLLLLAMMAHTSTPSSQKFGAESSWV